MNEREAFEAWYQNEYVQFGRANFHSNSYGEYFDDDIEFGWCAWQAALAHANVNEQSQAQQPTELSEQLREYAGNSGYSHNDYADTMLAAATEIERLASQAQQESHDELTLRRLLCMVYSGNNAYTDDGELQDNAAQPFIDFKRDSAWELQKKLHARVVNSLIKLHQHQRETKHD